MKRIPIIPPPIRRPMIIGRPAIIRPIHPQDHRSPSRHSFLIQYSESGISDAPDPFTARIANPPMKTTNPPIKTQSASILHLPSPMSTLTWANVRVWSVTVLLACLLTLRSMYGVCMSPKRKPPVPRRRSEPEPEASSEVKRMIAELHRMITAQAAGSESDEENGEDQDLNLDVIPVNRPRAVNLAAREERGRSKKTYRVTATRARIYPSTEKVLNWLRNHPDSTRGEISTGTSMNAGTVKFALRQLIHLGLVTVSDIR